MSQPKVTIKHSPSEHMSAEAKKEFDITDATGRKLTLKKPPFTAQFDLVALLGEKSRNSMYHTMVMPLTYVVAIDNEAVPFPQSERELRALIQRLDEHGYAALADGITEHFAQANSEEGKEAALKNS
jgi:hypothetical protein